VDTINENRLEWMREAGCWVVGFGVESGNQYSLDLMKKKAKLEDAQCAIALCKKYGIKVYTLFLIGLPWDTRETIKDTIRFSKILDADFIDINIAYPLPGTELFEVARKEHLFEESHMHGCDYSKPIIKTRHLSTEELIKLRRWGLLSFYFRPAYIIRVLSSVNSFKVLVSYIKAGFGLILKSFNAKPDLDLRDER
jgi:radical SAM superfamily enzyme YgiQ (UPF0313 family)